MQECPIPGLPNKIINIGYKKLKYIVYIRGSPNYGSWTKSGPLPLCTTHELRMDFTFFTILIVTVYFVN